MKIGGTVNKINSSTSTKTNLAVILCAFFVIISLIFIPVAPVFASEEPEVVSDPIIEVEEVSISETEPESESKEIEVTETAEETGSTEVETSNEVADESLEESGTEDESLPEENGETTDSEINDEGEGDRENIIEATVVTEVVDEIEESEEESLVDIDTPTDETVSPGIEGNDINSATTTGTTDVVADEDEVDGGIEPGIDETTDTSGEDEGLIVTDDSATTTDEVADDENEETTTEPEDSSNEKNTENEEVDELVTTPEDETDLADENISEVPEPQVYESVVFNDENKYQFSKDQCVGMGDGSFYCMEVDAVDSTLIADGVYAELDSEGDKEIFVKHAGEATQITDNAIDDDAPYFDEVSNTIVWHGLLDGRQQIFVYDVEEQKIEQITDERYNNVHPTRHGDITVWQGWVGSDWEIMLENKGEFTMVTDNDYHDISPSINGNHIIWQSFENNVWLVKIYDITTSVIETISDSDGGSVENPRFVLVYDTKFDNGDIETKGYDIKSGESVPLSATSTQLPPELPDPEPTEEERALVTPTMQIKKEDRTQSGDADGDGDTDSLDEKNHSEDDVVVRPYLDDLATSTYIGNPIDDVIVTPYVEGVEADIVSTTDDEIIEDIIIEPIFDLETDNELEADSETALAT